MAVMADFKKASSLYDQTAKRGAPLSKATKSKTRKCEHFISNCCEVSREALNLGLRKTVVPCTGNIPPDCKIRQDLADGKTIQEIYGK